MIIDIKKNKKNIVFSNHQPNHSWQKESYTEELHKESVVSSRGTPRYLILVIRRNGGNIMHNVIFLHAIAVIEKLHFIHLFLILRLQLLLLSDESNLQLIFMRRKPRL